MAPKARRVDPTAAEEEMVQASERAILDGWERYERLAEELRRAWPDKVAPQDVIDAIRH
jgi:hypothetical protein